jgi:hypothetical protein
MFAVSVSAASNNGTQLSVSATPATPVCNGDTNFTTANGAPWVHDGRNKSSQSSFATIVPANASSVVTVCVSQPGNIDKKRACMFGSLCRECV